MAVSLFLALVRLALVGALLLLNFSCLAQCLWPAYVVMHSGDSINGAIRLSPMHQQQARIKFVPLPGATQLVLRPEEVRSYGYIKGIDTVRYLACSFPMGTVSSYTKLVNRQHQVVNGMANLVMRLFLRQLVAGSAQLYERNVVNGGQGASASRRELLLSRRGQPIVNTYWWNFPKNAASFYWRQHCPSGRPAARPLPFARPAADSATLQPGKAHLTHLPSVNRKMRRKCQRLLPAFSNPVYLCSPIQNAGRETSRFSSVGRAAHS